MTGRSPGQVVQLIDSTELRRVPSQRLFKIGAAARYLGHADDTLKKHTDLGHIRAYDFYGVRVYKLEELDSLIDNLREWDDARGEKPAKVMEEHIS